MPQPATIQLRSTTGKHLVDPNADLGFILRHAGHFHLKRNKRGNITSARLKARTSLAALTNAGTSYIQKLDHGRTWALKGTTGSQPAPVVG